MIKQFLIGASALAMSTMAAAVAPADVIGQPGKDNLDSYFTTASPTPPPANANYTEVSQTGDGNSATETQAAASQNNYAKVEQGRTNAVAAQNNRATTSQTGNYNQVYVNQVAAEADNTANVVAGGAPTNFGTGGPNGGTGYASGQFNGTLAVTDGQLGGAGIKNNVTVTQTSNGGAVSNATANKAVVLQGSAITGVAAGGSIRSVASVTQSGNSNQAELRQGVGNDDNDGNNQSTVNQTGVGNYAENSQNEADRSTILQGANAGVGTGNTAYVDQVAAIGTGGSDNYGRQSVVRQFGSNNLSTVSQNGQRNASSVAQGDNGGAGPGSAARDSINNTASVTQTGSDGYSEIFQGVGSGDTNNATVAQTVNATFENSYVYQNGLANAGNTTLVGQDGARDVQVTYQNGIASLARTYQGTLRTGSADNVSTIDQTAGSNQGSASSFQDGLRNTTTITQNGVGDFGYVTQGETAGATDNRATISQATTTNSAFALIAQGFDAAATNNVATVEQRIGATGYGTIGYAEQVGDSNTATVTQSIGLVQGFTIQNGNNNTASINQFNNVAAASIIQQVGNTNTATSNQ